MMVSKGWSGFKDYVSTYDEFRSKMKSLRRIDAQQVRKIFEVDENSYESVYKSELASIDSKYQFGIARMKSELAWYRNRRPYFNVYPYIEKKLCELSENIDMSELSLPFESIEVRTKTTTVLMCNHKSLFLFVMELGGGIYQEIAIPRMYTIGKTLHLPASLVAEHWNPTGDAIFPHELVRSAIFICAGTCMLASDKSIVTPVVLNKHRKDGMTEEERAAYAEKAIRRTGRIGFDVGRHIEKLRATAHYRNGCFAKYYVGKNHELYPKNSELIKAPVIKWRSGAIVNKDVLPSVPTGFKDTGITCHE